MLPWAIAATRNKSNTLAIALVNVLLGWTLVGWIVALVMSASSEPRPVVYLNTAVLPAPYPALPTQYQAYGPATSQALPPASPTNPWLTQQQQQPHGYAPAPYQPADQPAEPTAVLPPYDDQPWSRPSNLR